MQKKQVAVIDMGSSSVTAIVGERGINSTFIIKGRYSFPYDGFENGEFFDTENLRQALTFAADAIKKSSSGEVGTVYVGVPADFTQVVVRESQISFSGKKRIREEDVDALFDAAFVLSSTKYSLINRSAVLYELDDSRRLANPLGEKSEILKGRLSFVLCSNYFIETVRPMLEARGINKVECVSSTLAEALYLVDTETRDRVAVLLDVGYITTSFSIIQGDGMLYQNSFAYGGGYVTAAIVEKFGISFEEAERLKRKVNLSSVSYPDKYDVIEGTDGKYYNVEELKSVIKTSLDVLCEKVSESLENSGYAVPDYVPLLITGGGIAYLRGAKEHLSARLDTIVGIVAPKVPLMDKPTEASALSLLDLALEQIK